MSGRVTLIALLVFASACGANDDEAASSSSAVLGATVTTTASAETVASSASAATTSSAATSTTMATTTSTVAPALMPSLVGLAVSDADQQLFGLEPSEIRIEEEPSLELAGTVLDQLPAAGIEIRGLPVTLTVAAPLPPMPDLAGTRVGEARTLLSGWGVEVREVEELSTDRPNGEVLRSLPTPGEVIGAEVELVVAAAPVIANLVDFSYIERSRTDRGTTWGDGAIEANGELHDSSIWASSRSGNAAAGDIVNWDYNLGRDWEVLTATLGVGDSSDIETRARFRVILDGNVVDEFDVQFGETVPIEVNVSGALRLRIENLFLTGGRAVHVWGTPQLLGLPSVVADQ